MKKIFILIFAAILLFITYNFYENKKVNKDKIDDNKEVSYRIEESLIEEESNSDVTEADLTTYILEVTEEVEDITSQETLSDKDESILKNTFITLTDFIFYDGTIKGKTFNELTSTTKENVIALYENIDSKIENKIPNYKETIKETSKKTYSNIKTKLVSLKDELLLKYREEIGEENYQTQGELLEESISTMKDSFSPVIDTIIDKSKETYENIKEQTSTWYAELKEENKR